MCLERQDNILHPTHFPVTASLKWTYRNKAIEMTMKLHCRFGFLRKCALQVQSLSYRFFSPDKTRHFPTHQPHNSKNQVHGRSDENRCQTHHKYRSCPTKICLIEVQCIIIFGTAEMRITLRKTCKRTIAVIVIGVNIFAVFLKGICTGFK